MDQKGFARLLSKIGKDEHTLYYANPDAIDRTQQRIRSYPRALV